MFLLCCGMRDRIPPQIIQHPQIKAPQSGLLLGGQAGKRPAGHPLETGESVIHRSLTLVGQRDPVASGVSRLRFPADVPLFLQRFQ